ncbi:MAG: 3-oxoacyl-[acyl-carrier-protein] synthase III C-terminal domain-containing protein [Myxococcota bacterium]
MQHALELGPVPAMDLAAACAGFVYGLDLAARAVLTGDRAVLLAAGECRVRSLDRAAAGVRVLFGDGAAAAVIARGDDPDLAAGGLRLALVATALGADGAGHDAIRVEAGGSRQPASLETVAAGLHALAMVDGPHVFYRAVEGFVEIGRALLDPLGLTPADIDLIVPHQPNLRILERVARLMRLPLERFALEVADIGNVGGASVGIALDRALRAGRIGPGAKVVLLTAGAGYTAAAALLEVVA